MYPEMSILEIKRTTLADFEVMQRAKALEQVDEMYKASIQAWQNAVVQATDSKGKPKFRRFKQFFDYEKEIKRVKGGNKPSEALKRIDRTSISLVANANLEGGDGE